MWIDNVGTTKNYMVLLISLFLFFFGNTLTLYAQKNKCLNPAEGRGLVDVRENPRKGIKFSSSVKFKIATRKTTYKVNEMIEIYLAMLNISKESIFIRSLENIELEIRDEHGNLVDISPYEVNTITPKFKLIGLREIITGQYSLFTNCQEEGLQQWFETRNKVYDRRSLQTDSIYELLFDNDLFVRWGDSCLMQPKLGKYTISVKQKNVYNVVKSECEPNIKTTVGEITSSPLMIELIQ
jgi:hypothetical protein